MIDASRLSPSFDGNETASRPREVRFRLVSTRREITRARVRESEEELRERKGPPSALAKRSRRIVERARARQAHQLAEWRRRSRYPTLNRSIAGVAGGRRRRESHSLIIRIPGERAVRWTYGDDRITPSVRP